jgi:hypothetical protein
VPLLLLLLQPWLEVQLVVVLAGGKAAHAAC